MVCCFVPQCPHRSNSGSSIYNCKFRRFPRNKALRNKWINLIRRKDKQPTNSSLVCTCHFDDCHSNPAMRNLPTEFPWNAEKRMKFVSLEKKEPRKRAATSDELPETDHLSIPTETVFFSASTSTPSEDLSESLPDTPVAFHSISSQTDHQSEPAFRSISIQTDPPSEPASRSISTQTDPPSEPTSQSISTQTEHRVEPEFRSISTQTNHSFGPAYYEAQLYFKSKEIEELKKEIDHLKSQPFGMFMLKERNDMYLHYTGLSIPAFNLVKELCSLVPLKYRYNEVQRLSFEDQLLMTFMKLRLNSPYLDLSMRFGVSKTTVCNIISTFLPVLHFVVFQSIMENIPSQTKCHSSMPQSFQHFPNSRLVIDCTELKCEIPKNMREQKLTYSHYKKSNTVKILIGISPNTTVVYCSSAYPGSVSDKEIVKHCGLLEKLEPGDLILADKGFLIQDLLPQGVSLNIPPFLSSAQFSVREVEQTRNIAKARVHIERVNQRLKRYRILNHVPKKLFSNISMVVQVCAGLINFQNPLLKCMSKDFVIDPATMVDEIEVEEEWEL